MLISAIARQGCDEKVESCIWEYLDMAFFIAWTRQLVLRTRCLTKLNLILDNTNSCSDNRMDVDIRHNKKKSQRKSRARHSNGLNSEVNYDSVVYKLDLTWYGLWWCCDWNFIKQSSHGLGLSDMFMVTTGKRYCIQLSLMAYQPK